MTEKTCPRCGDSPDFTEHDGTCWMKCKKPPLAVTLPRPHNPSGVSLNDARDEDDPMLMRLAQDMELYETYALRVAEAFCYMCGYLVKVAETPTTTLVGFGKAVFASADRGETWVLVHYQYWRTHDDGTVRFHQEWGYLTDLFRLEKAQ